VAPFVPGKININTCSLADLQDLPGVSPAMGAHILAGRPYRNFADLERNGVPLNVVTGLRKVVTFGERP
jgi:DNA uptake protein ComE-like DNA-binding protein